MRLVLYARVSLYVCVLLRFAAASCVVSSSLTVVLQRWFSAHPQRKLVRVAFSETQTMRVDGRILTLTLSSLACFFSLQSCGPEGYEALIHTPRGCFELAFLSV